MCVEVLLCDFSPVTGYTTEARKVCLCREFAERAFQAAKKEAAALDAGGWNVGSVITDKKDRQDNSAPRLHVIRILWWMRRPRPRIVSPYFPVNLGRQPCSPLWCLSAGRLGNSITLSQRRLVPVFLSFVCIPGWHNTQKSLLCMQE